MKIKAMAVILILASMLVSCGNASQTPVTDSPAATEEQNKVTEETKPDYIYPSLNLNGDKFTILNSDQTYGFYGTLDLTEATGDILDDAVYRRNSELEEMYNFDYEINEEYLYGETGNNLRKVVLAGDDVYDVAFIADTSMSVLITDGCCMNLDDISTLNLDKPWWDNDATRASRIGANPKTLFTVTDVSLVDFEGTTCVYFNKNMAENLGLEAPYQLVRDGKWTFEEFRKYLKAGTNLNGDESWALNPNGNCIYGLLTWDKGYSSLLMGMGADYFIYTESGVPEIQVETEKFINLAAKISNGLAADGEFVNANDEATLHCEKAFKDRRSFMAICELKATNKLRDMDNDFGIVPMPKNDENQESYRSLRAYSFVMCIPVTNSRTEETGIIMDAMSYKTRENVMPAYYEGKLSAKQLRDMDSVDMLNIIRDTRYYDPGITFGWSGTLRTSFFTVVTNKSTDFASENAKNVPAIQAKIDSLMEQLQS